MPSVWLQFPPRDMQTVPQLVCHLYHRIGYLAKEICRSHKHTEPYPQDSTTNAVHDTHLTLNHRQASIKEVISICKESSNVEVLSDTGTDISIAGPSIIQSLKMSYEYTLYPNVAPQLSTILDKFTEVIAIGCLRRVCTFSSMCQGFAVLLW